jgi:hypothetical protein
VADLNIGHNARITAIPPFDTIYQACQGRGSGPEKRLYSQQFISSFAFGKPKSGARVAPAIRKPDPVSTGRIGRFHGADEEKPGNRPGFVHAAGTVRQPQPQCFPIRPDRAAPLHSR